MSALAPAVVAVELGSVADSRLEPVLADFVSTHAPGDAVLRLAAGLGDLDAIYARVEDTLSRVCLDPQSAPDIEILPLGALEATRPGDAVLVATAEEAVAVAKTGRVPVEDARRRPAARTPADELRRRLGWLAIGWSAEARRGSGYADEARTFLQSLDAAGLEPALWTVPSPEIELAPETERLLRRCEARRPEPHGLALVLHHLPDGSLRLPPGAVGIQRTMFETDSIPRGWVDVLARRRRIWVPAPFNVETFAAGGVDADRIRVLPGTIDFARFRPDVRPRPLPGKRAFAFLSNFDFTERKAWRTLLTAYATEFAGDDDVTLVLKVSTQLHDRATIAARIEDHLHASGIAAGRLPHVLLVSDMLPDSAMPALYTACDAYVSPTRGEGWGRPFQEALACGLPTIASRFGGQLAFLDDGNAWLVDGTLVPVQAGADLGQPELYHGHRWFEADVDALRAAMRAVHANPEISRRRALAARPAHVAAHDQAVIAERIAALVLDAFQD